MSKELYLEALDWLRQRVQREGETPEELHAMARRIASFEDHETADDFIRFYAESLTQTDPDKWPDLEWILETKGGGILMSILGPLSQWVELMCYRGQFGQRVADEIVTLTAERAAAVVSDEIEAAIRRAHEQGYTDIQVVTLADDATLAAYGVFDDDSLKTPPADDSRPDAPGVIWTDLEAGLNASGWCDDDDDDGDYPEGFWADDDDEDDGDLWEDDPDEAREYVGDGEDDDD